MPRSFCWTGEEYGYEDVAHFRRYAKLTSVNFIPVSQSLRVTVYIRDRDDPIILKNKLSIPGTTGKLADAYAALSKATFSSRASSYLREWSECGYFDYDGRRFLDTGEIQHPGGTIDLDLCTYSRAPFEVRFKPKRRDEAPSS